MSARALRSLLVQVLAPRGTRRRRHVDVLRARFARSAAVSPVTMRRSGAAPSATKVLVIDHRLPTPAHDSGSVRMLAMLEALTGHGCEVGFVPADLHRPAQTSEHFELRGITILADPRELSRYLHRFGRDIDICWISRPEQAGAYQPLLARRCPNATFIYDSVDLHGSRLRSTAAATGSLRDRIRAQYVARLEQRAIKAADITLVVTEEERQMLHGIAPMSNVTVLPNIHDMPTRRPPAFGERSGILFVGGFEHHPNVDAVAYLLDELAPRLERELPDATISIAGPHAPEELVARSPANVTFLGWVPELLPLYDRSRLSIAPLRYGAGMKGKVGEAMAASLPVVTTSIGAEGFDAAPNEDLLIAENPTDFVEAVIRAYTDEVLWSRLAENGRRLIEERFSTAPGQRRVRQLLDDIAANAGR